LPRFAGLFETLDAPLPPTTQMLLTISDVLRSKWWMLLILAVITVFAGKYALSTPTGRRTLDTWLVRLPYLGHFVRSLITARIARLLGVLLSSQVQLLEALQLTRRATVNTRYADLMQRAEEGVANGNPLSASFEGTHLINPSMTEAIRHGEQSGQLAVVLTDMAEFMDEENEVVVRTLASIVEPIILIVLGVVVAVLALSMFMPLFDLTSLTQGGA
ncbi:MAG: type II secretion system F family protein, partial [Phycisphaerales bacterium]